VFGNKHTELIGGCYAYSFSLISSARISWPQHPGRVEAQTFVRAGEPHLMRMSIRFGTVFQPLDGRTDRAKMFQGFVYRTPFSLRVEDLPANRVFHTVMKL
jgi:hypothetical protein